MSRDDCQEDEAAETTRTTQKAQAGHCPGARTLGPGGDETACGGGIQDNANLIPADEPVVLLRAQDSCAEAAIKAWILEASCCGVDGAVIDSMKDNLELIRSWPKKKLPDLNRPQIPSAKYFADLQNWNKRLSIGTVNTTVFAINTISKDSAADTEFDAATVIGSDTIMLTVSAASGQPERCYEISGIEIHGLGL